MLKTLLQSLNSIGGPKGGIIEKGLFALVMYAAGKGWIANEDVSTLVAVLYGLVSAGLTGATTTQQAKILDINDTQSNGVKVVPATVPAPKVDAPIPISAL